MADLSKRFQASWTQVFLLAFAGLAVFMILSFLFVGGETAKIMLASLIYFGAQLGLLAFILRWRRAKDAAEPGPEQPSLDKSKPAPEPVREAPDAD